MSAMSNGTFRNWSGWVTARPRHVARPANDDELKRVIAAAVADGATLRALGAGHSFTPLVATEGVLVSLERMAGIYSVDTDKRQVTLGAGTSIHALGPALRNHGFALANQGDIDYQAIAGATATGTHGTGLGLGSLSTQIAGLKLLTAAGETVEIDRERTPELFDAARVSLGTLGIVTELTLDVEPVYKLHEKRWTMALDDCLDQLDELLAATRHFEFFWFGQSSKALCKSLALTDEPVKKPGIGQWFSDYVMENGGLWVCCNLSRVPAFLGPMARLSAALGGEEERINFSPEVFACPRLVRFNEMEYALPAAAARDCALELQAMFRDTNPQVYFPVEFRRVAADDIWLSPFHERESVTFAVHQYHKQDYAEFFAACEAIFRNHAGRPHWGKLHTRKPDELAALYPRWDDFHRIRRELDPKGIFMNDYLRQLFGETASA